MKIDKFLRKLNSKSEEERLKLLWFLVGFSMLIVFIAWFLNFNSNLGRLGAVSLDTSSLPSFPEANQIAHLEEIAERGNDILESAEANLSQEYWQNIGQEYLAKENFFGDDSFSELKISGVENENGVVLIKYEHYYKGLLVYGSRLFLYFDAKSGEFIKAENNLEKEINIEIDPVISSQSAVEIARKHFGDDEVVFKNSSLVIVSLDEVYYLTWNLSFENLKDLSDIQIFVGAKNGGVILLEELDK